MGTLAWGALAVLVAVVLYLAFFRRRAPTLATPEESAAESKTPGVGSQLVTWLSDLVGGDDDDGKPTTDEAEGSGLSFELEPFYKK